MVDRGALVRRLLDPRRLTDAVWITFAGWTVICHSTVLLGGSLDDALIATTIVLALVAIGVAVRSRTLRVAAQQPAHAGGPEPHPRRFRRASGVVAVAGLTTWLAVFAGLPWQVVWGLGASLLAIAALLVLLEPAGRQQTAREPHVVFIWALALACAVITLCANRPDIDDSLYVCMAAAAADRPDAPLHAGDHLHGVDGVPVQYATYRVHTIEVLAGALARLTGVAAISWLHLVFSPLAAVLAVFALARVAWLVAPDRWQWITGVTVMILLYVGDAHAWYGNVAFVRLHQGKGIFATALVPVIIAAGIELARRPSRAGWVRLAGAQIAAVGTTATALWVAPVVAALAVVSASQRGRSRIRTVLIGLSTTVYPIVLAAAFWFGMHHPDAAVARAITGSPPPATSVTAVEPDADARQPNAADVEARLSRAVSYVLGDRRLPMAVLGLLLWGWWLSPERMVRRLHLVFAAFFAVVWVNPFLVRYLAGAVTGEGTFWRVVWTLPVPILGACALTFPVARLRRWGPALAVVVTVAALVGLRSAPVFDQHRGARLGAPGLKVPAEYRVAEALVGRVPSGSVVVAPNAVAPWVTTFHHHPYPVIARRQYLGALLPYVGDDEVFLRHQATVAVTKPGRSREVDFKLLELVDDRPVAGVVITTEGFNPGRIEAGLRARGYAAVWSNESYRIWVVAGDRTSTGTPPPKRRAVVSRQRIVEPIELETDPGTSPGRPVGRAEDRDVRQPDLDLDRVVLEVDAVPAGQPV
jgi:hypothetical protein